MGFKKERIDRNKSPQAFTASINPPIPNSFITRFRLYAST